jgi:hypothetical protein
MVGRLHLVFGLKWLHVVVCLENFQLEGVMVSVCVVRGSCVVRCANVDVCG